MPIIYDDFKPKYQKLYLESGDEIYINFYNSMVNYIAFINCLEKNAKYSIEEFFSEASCRDKLIDIIDTSEEAIKKFFYEDLKFLDSKFLEYTCDNPNKNKNSSFIERREPRNIGY